MIDVLIVSSPTAMSVSSGGVVNQVTRRVKVSVLGAVKYNVAKQLRVVELKWFTEFGHLNRGDMLTSEQHRCHNEKK
ncbi:hypothetical protein, partial [Escherichia coli]